MKTENHPTWPATRCLFAMEDYSRFVNCTAKQSCFEIPHSCAYSGV